GLRRVAVKADADRRRLRFDRITTSLTAVGVARVLRLASVQSRERTAGRDGGPADRLATAGTRGGELAANDLAGLDAGRADIDAVLVTTGTGGNAHALDVGIPPTAGPAMGVRHRLAEAGALPADIADGSHTWNSSNSGAHALPGAPTPWKNSWRRAEPPKRSTIG